MTFRSSSFVALRALVLGAAAVGVAPTRAVAAPEDAEAGKAPPADRFAADVDALHKAVVAQQWKQGADLARTILTRYEGDLRVLSRLDEIEDDLRTCLWRVERKNVPLVDVIGCGAVRANTLTREVHFGAGSPLRAAGWSGDGQLRVFEVPLEDAEVTVTTRSWWSSDGTTYRITPPPAVVLHYDSERSGGYVFAAEFGEASQSYLGKIQVPLSGKIARWGEKEKELGAGGAGLTLDPASTIELVCAEKSGSLTMRSGKTVLKRTTDTTHRSGLVALVGLEDAIARARVSVVGRVDARYLRRIENEFEERREREWLEANYRRETALPKWVLDAEAEAAYRRAMLPSDATPVQRTWFRERWEKLLEGDEAVHAATRKWLPKAPKLAGAYVRALLHVVDGEHRDAEEAVRGVLDAEPGFGPGWALLAMSAWDRHDRAAAELAVATAAVRADYHPWTWEVAAGLALDDGRFDEAEAALHAAAGHMAGSPALKDLRRTLLRLRRGPSWTKRFETQSTHFVVASDHSVAVCQEIASILEEARSAYRTQFRARDDGRKARVLVFSGEESYLDYAEELGSDLTGSLGVYRPRLRELCVFLHEDRRQLKDTVRHEGFHQYLHQFLEDAPIWFNEGYAEYFGFGRKKGGKHVAGEVGFTQAALVTEHEAEFVPLEKLFVMSQREFMSKAGPRYVQAWAVIHMLRESKHPQIKGVLDRYFDALLAGRSREQAFHDVLEPLLPVLRTEFAAQVMRMKVR